MPVQLSASTLAVIRHYLEEGIPLEDCDLSSANKERVRIAEKVYERLQQDPMLDVNRCLMRSFGRSYNQAQLDKQVIDMLIESLDGVSRKLLMFRARKIAENIIRIGEQTGDANTIVRGWDRMVKLDRLNEADNEQQQIKSTAQLPPILVDLNVINPEKQGISEEQFRRLINKYDGKEDEFDKLVAIHAKRMRGEDVSTDFIATIDKDEDE